MPQEIEAEPDPTISVIGVALNDYNLEIFKDGRQIASRAWRAGQPQIMPAGVKPRAVLKTPWRLLHIYMPQTLLREAASELGWDGCVDLRDPVGEEDPQLHRLAIQMSHEILIGAQSSRLKVEGISCLAAAHLVRRWSSVLLKPSRTTALAPWQINRCVELLHSRFADDISLDVLADEARLSTFHFARAFKAATGVAPHRYQLHIRLKEAQRLLTETDLTVSAIAGEVGYADQGALTRLFRKVLGTTPSRYRRERRK